MQAAALVSVMLNAFVIGGVIVVGCSSINRRILSRWLWYSAEEMDDVREARHRIKSTRLAKEKDTPVEVLIRG